jgi:hypothetical protein
MFITLALSQSSVGTATVSYRFCSSFESVVFNITELALILNFQEQQQSAFYREDSLKTAFQDMKTH